jgi:uncharacterized damage-inducible protein DinB
MAETRVVKKQPWFERQFPSGLAAARFPLVIERLRGTPARLEDRLIPLPRDALTRRIGSTWSIQENAGHLLDLEPLWLQRVDDLMNRRATLTGADLENRRTHEANHNVVLLATILGDFRRARQLLLDRLEAVDDAVLAYTALHPRLRQPMNLIDHAQFVAEHDDYHLARVSELLGEFGVMDGGHVAVR